MIDGKTYEMVSTGELGCPGCAFQFDDCSDAGNECLESAYCGYVWKLKPTEDGKTN